MKEGGLGQETRDGSSFRLLSSVLQATKRCVYLSYSVISHPEIRLKYLLRLEVAYTASHYKSNITEFRTGNPINSPRFQPRADCFLKMPGKLKCLGLFFEFVTA